MLLPVKHENMSARRWPVVTLALIAINTAVFLLTTMTMNDQAPELGEVKSDILILADDEHIQRCVASQPA